MKCSEKRLIVFFLLVFTLSFQAFAAEIDQTVENDIHNKGYAQVIVFVDAPLSENAQQLLAQEEKDSGDLKKILAEKKAVIRNQQRKVLRELDLGTKVSSDVDLVLDDKYQYINGFSGTLTAEGLEKLKNDETVIGIYSNEQLQIMLDTATPFLGAPFAETVIQNTTAITGQGIGICVIDTGVDTTHPALQGKIVDQYCYCSQGTGCCPNNLTEDTSATDDNGHGTGVIGTIVSQDPLYKGIAPGANIMVVKAFSSSGSATMSDVISGIGKCLEKAETDNIKIFSFSFGGPTYPGTCDGDALASITNDLANMGFIVVAASGNNGNSAGISTPACGSNVTSVGAVYDNSSTLMDTVASFSNANSYLDLLAPGVMICTPKAQKSGGTVCYTDSKGGIYKLYSGTSFSTPLAAGAAALIAQYTIAETGTFDPIAVVSDLKTYGQPVLDSRNGLLFPRVDIQNTLMHIDHTAPNLTVSIVNNTRHIFVTAEATDAINSIALCKFSLNGINETMNITSSGRTGTCTIEKDITENTNYTVYAMDANGNSAQYEGYLELINTAPILNTYEPSNTTLSYIAPTNVTFSITAEDAENDVLQYTWKLNDIIVSQESTYLFSALTQGTYILQATVSDGVLETAIAWNITVIELKAPTVYDVAVMPTTAYRNENLTCNYTYNDTDPEQGTIIQWYLNNTFNRNATTIPKEELLVGDAWKCSVIASDGLLFSDATQSSARVIQNHAPTLTANNVAVARREPATIHYTTSDEDNDSVTVSVNDSRFVDFTMNTINAETFSVLLTASDGYDTTQHIVTIAVYDNQTDYDQDGIIDSLDKINGSVAGFGLFVNGDAVDNSTLNDDDALVSLKQGEKTVVEFTFDFSTQTLSLIDTEITESSQGNGNIVITGLDIESKTVYMNALNTSTNGVCIQDVENPDIITSYCTGPHEIFVICNGTAVDHYTCTAVGDKYKITGLHHSAITQKCIDTDSDGYGLGCSAGGDCVDTNAAISPGASEIADNGIDDNCDGVSATTPTETIVETTPKAAAAGGGGAGPSIFEEETTEQAAVQEQQQEEAPAVVETNIPGTEKETPVETGFLTESLVSSSGLTDLTGAAISDMASGRVTGSSFSLLFMIIVCCGLLVGGGYYAIKHKRIHEQIDFFSAGEAFKTIYDGIKDMFKR